MINTIYIENEVRRHPRTQVVLEKLSQARQIIINRYGEVFNKHSQNFRLQKKERNETVCLQQIFQVKILQIHQLPKMI